MNRSVSILLTALLAAVLLAACGGEQQVRTVTANPTPVQEQAEQTPEAGTEAEAGGTPAPGSEAIVTGTGTADDDAFVIEITELKRSGPTVVLNARLSLAESEDEDASLQVASEFADSATGADVASDAFDGVALIDPQNRKKYLVARDSDDNCVCSRDLSSTFVTLNATADLQATLTAPPPDVKTVDLSIPKVKTFTKVPIADE